MNKYRERRRSRSRSRDRDYKPRQREKPNQYRRRSKSPQKSNERSFDRPKYGRNRDQESHSKSHYSRTDNPQRHYSGNRNRPDHRSKSNNWGRSHSNNNHEVQVKTEPTSPKPEIKKEGPDFKLSGKLAEDTNIYNGVVIKYNEPPEARKPKRRWRLYAFKGETELPMLPIHRQSAYLLGRDRKVADIPIDHPSCSKQHAVLQYRVIKYKRDDDSFGKRVRPYIIDLESANGTFVNNQQIDGRRYVELFEKDVIKFGFSTREYVLLHEESKDDDLDDDVVEEENAEAENTEAENTEAENTETVTANDTAT